MGLLWFEMHPPELGLWLCGREVENGRWRGGRAPPMSGVWVWETVICEEEIE